MIAASISASILVIILACRSKRKPTLTDKILNDRLTYEQSKHFLLKQMEERNSSEERQRILDAAYAQGKREGKPKLTMQALDNAFDHGYRTASKEKCLVQIEAAKLLEQVRDLQAKLEMAYTPIGTTITPIGIGTTIVARILSKTFHGRKALYEGEFKRERNRWVQELNPDSRRLLYDKDIISIELII